MTIAKRLGLGIIVDRMASAYGYATVTNSIMVRGVISWLKDVEGTV